MKWTVIFRGDTNIVEKFRSIHNRIFNSLARLANNITLQSPREYLINNTVAMMWIILNKNGGSFTMSMKYIQSSNEELMSILLFITRQMSSVCPYQM